MGSRSRELTVDEWIGSMSWYLLSSSVRRRRAVSHLTSCRGGDKPSSRSCTRCSIAAAKSCANEKKRTHTHTQPFNGPWSATTRVRQYQKKHSPTHTHPDYRTSFINFLHLLQSIASSVFSLRAWQSSLTTSLQVLFGLPLGVAPSTSYSMHFFTQSSSSFHSTCP